MTTTRVVPSNRFRCRFPTQGFGSWVLEEYEVVSDDLEEWIRKTSWKVIHAFLSKGSPERTARILWLNNTIFIAAYVYPFQNKVTLQEGIVPQRQADGDWNEVILEALFKPHKDHSFHAYVVGIQPFQQLIAFPRDLQRLCEIRLDTVSLNDEECDALTRFGGSLAFYNCHFSEGGQSLANGLLKDDRGLTGLKFLGRCPFDRKGYSAFCRALQVNTSLGALSFWKCTPRSNHSSDDWTNLLIAIRGNCGLSELHLVGVSLTNRQWGLLCSALASHPTIQTLELACFSGNLGDKAKDVQIQGKDGMQRMHSLAGALVRNEVIMRVNISLQQGQMTANQAAQPSNQKLVISRPKRGSSSFTVATKCGAIIQSRQVGEPLPC